MLATKFWSAAKNTFQNQKYLVLANFNSFNFFRLRPITYYCIFPLGLQGFSSPFLFVLLQLPTSEWEYEGAIKPLELCKAVLFEPMQLFQVFLSSNSKVWTFKSFRLRKNFRKDRFEKSSESVFHQTVPRNENAEKQKLTLRNFKYCKNGRRHI